MADNFNQEIFDIISKRVDKKLLEGFRSGVFNPKKDKLTAFTLVDLKQVNYKDFSWNHQKLSGHSSYLNHEESEKKKKWVSANSLSSKSVEECINEGIYRFFSISFLGIYFKNDWFILSELNFYGNHYNENSAIQFIQDSNVRGNLWENQIFKPVEIFTTHNIHGHEKIVKNVDFEEFENYPFLVAIQKQRNKEEVNRLFWIYFNKEYIEPFFQKLKIINSNKYESFFELRGHFTCVFSSDKRNIIFCALIFDNKNVGQLYYFVLLKDKFYRWTHFKPRSLSALVFYSQLIIDDLKQISHWDEDAYLDSSCTMDDINFWNEYVFKKNDNNEFIYLKEMINVSSINKHAYN